MFRALSSIALSDSQLATMSLLEVISCILIRSTSEFDGESSEVFDKNTSIVWFGWAHQVTILVAGETS